MFAALARRYWAVVFANYRGNSGDFVLRIPRENRSVGPSLGVNKIDVRSVAD